MFRKPEIYPMLSEIFARLFNDPTTWAVYASGQAVGTLTKVGLKNGGVGLRLDYDFHDGGGFIVARKEVKFTLPETFEINFRLRSESPANHFEFKLSDPCNENTWRYFRDDFRWPKQWATQQIRERDLPFAWGPAGGGAPSEVGSMEFVVSAGPGGKGSIWLAEFSLEDQTFVAPAGVEATSELPGHEADQVFSMERGSCWRAAMSDERPHWTVDFGRMQRFGGLVIHWPEDLPSKAYKIEISRGGRTWKVVHRTRYSSEKCSHVTLPDGEARFLRICFRDPVSAGISGLVLKPDAFSHTPNEFMHAVAKDFPRGWHPRYWHREQSYWTPIATPDGTKRALINEEGLVEPDEGSFSLEPFLLVDGILITWADVETQVGLPECGAPLPYVKWKADELVLTIQPWVEGHGYSRILRVSYQIENPKRRNVKLAVAVRPFQVNPPWQAFRNLGGRSPISKIRCGNRFLTVEGRKVIPDKPANEQGVAAFEEGTVMAFLARGRTPQRREVNDASLLASGVMMWEAEVEKVTISVPYADQIHPLSANSYEHALDIWREKLNTTSWEVPDHVKSHVECFRTAAAHILVNRDGPALQPGPRRYTRTWVRDSVIMGAALMKAGVSQTLKEFLNFYQPFQRADGFVPCVVDRDGVDWLVEHDSHGQFIWGVYEVFRHDHDREFLWKMWPAVKQAADFLRKLRKERLTCDYQTGEHSACYGLLPLSASHEGYLAHPVHSYWDDFWGVRGLEAAADIAIALNENGKPWQEEAGHFTDDLMRSIKSVIADKKLEYIPGSVEWADFDPTATSNAIGLLDFADELPAGQLEQMFDIYMRDFRLKRQGKMPWKNYTAYEIRIVSALIRLGRRDDAQEVMDFFLSDRRPCEWHQWPEISWRDLRAPGHLGDVPHTWISAEYILAFTSMIVSEREAKESLVLASGMPWDWISGESGFSLKDMPTRYGMLDFHIRALSAHEITAVIGGSLTIPVGGVHLCPPLPQGLKINSATDSKGESLVVDPVDHSVIIHQLPCQANLQLSPTP